MKVCVTASEKSLEAPVDPLFGRCRYFLIVDGETMKFDAVDNEGAISAHGAGIRAAQTVINQGVEAIITGNIGPNAYQVLATAGMKVITGTTGTVREAVERYMRGELQTTSSFTVSTHSGLGGGRGVGYGWARGMGRGRRLASGRGIESPASSMAWPIDQTSPKRFDELQKPEDEVRALEECKRKLEEDLEGVKARIKELKDMKESGLRKT